MFGFVLAFCVLCVNVTYQVDVNPSNVTQNVSQRVFNLDCGGIFTQKQFVVESKGYPDGYGKNLDCAFVFRGEDCPTYYNLQFLDFDLEQSLGCTKDRLEIENKDALCGTVIGVKNYYGPRGILQLKFLSDDQIQGRGFRILITRQPCDYNPNETTTTTESGGMKAHETEPTIEPALRRNQYDLCHNVDDPGSWSVPNYPSGPSYPLYPNPTAPNYPGNPNYPTYPSYPNYPTNPSFPNQPQNPPQYPSNPMLPSNPLSLPHCCANSYNTKRFFIASPGFPYSNNNNPSDCVYHIHKANANICRLRMHFLFYWNGEQGPTGCNKGFLQIDGKHICGCRVGLKLISSFDARWGDSPKTIRFRNEGYPNTVFSGFAIEVIQDECPRRYTPVVNATKFHYYNDQVNRIAWPNFTRENLIEKAHLIEESPEILGEKATLNATNGGEKSMVMRHFYFYQSPDNASDISPMVGNQNGRRRDVEETTYVDTSNLNPFLPDGNDNYKCRMWGVLQWTLLAKEASWRKMPKCVSSNVPVMQKCTELAAVQGYVQSPGYPYYYPSNLNLCYRFIRQRGYCGVSLYMADFDVEDSYQCRKDYLLVGRKYRYCGRSLQNTYTRLDLSYKPYEDVHFITDTQICGRGFRGLYEQIPCSDPGFPTHPPYLPPTTTTPSPVNPLPCDRQISEEFFTIEVYGYHRPTCNFNIVRNRRETCRLDLTFVSFDLQCNYEYLLINNRRYCGALSGQTVLFNFHYGQLPIVYRRQDDSWPDSSGLRLKLNGRQTSENCDPDIEVPAERQQQQQQVPVVKSAEKFKRLDNSSMEVVKRGDKNYEIILRNDLDDVCGLIMNVTQSTGPEGLCDALLKSSSKVECVPLTSQAIYLPYNANKIELTVDSVDMIDEMDFVEVSCSDLEL